MWPDAWLNQLSLRHCVPRKKFEFQELRTDVEPAGRERGEAQTPRELREDSVLCFTVSQ